MRFSVVACRGESGLTELVLTSVAKLYQIDVEAHNSSCNEEKVHSLHEDKAKEVGVVATADAVIQPLAVVVKPVHAPVANVAVPAAGQYDDRAVRADLLHLELGQEVHH